MLPTVYGFEMRDGERELVTCDLELCSSRLKSLVNRLKNDPELLFKYNHIIEDQLQKGIVERVPAGELDSCQAHYLPHHGVVRSEKETTKLRVVFDGSAKENEGSSLLTITWKRDPIIYHLCSTPW